MPVFALACATLLAHPAAGAPKPPARAVQPEQLWTQYPLDPTEAATPASQLTVSTASTAPGRRSPSNPVAETAPAGQDEPLIGLSSPSLQLGLLAALGLVVVFTAFSSLSLLVPAPAPVQPGRDTRARRPSYAASRIRRKAGPEPAALRPAAIPSEPAPETIEQKPRRAGRPATWLTESYESCEIAIWRGYWKGRFYARPTFPEPGDYAIEASPYFRIRSDLPKQRGGALRAYEQLVERLIRQGWEPSGLGGEWYEQWFRRALLATPGPPRPGETANGTKTPA